MSILIKGMEMPKKRSILRCSICVAPNGLASIGINSGHGKPYSEFHEIVEVPTPHGRLIDADKLTQYIERAYGDKDIINLVVSGIKRQPTIINAEVSKQ